MTAIADTRLQELYEATLEIGDTPTTNAAEHAFCAALNERLEAAERLVETLEWYASNGKQRFYFEDSKTKSHIDFTGRARDAVAAYRQSKEHT